MNTLSRYVEKDDLTPEELGKRAALAAHLELDASSLRLNEYDRLMWTVSPRMEREGTSPNEAGRLVATLREALAKLGTFRPFTAHVEPTLKPLGAPQSAGVYIGHAARRGSTLDGVGYCRDCHYPEGAKVHAEVNGAEMSYDVLRAIRYHTLVRMLRENPDTAPMLSLGLHDVVNTLYFLSADTDNYDHAREHRDRLRATFKGEPVEDTRPFREVSSGEYLVLTDSERETRWDEALDSMLDDKGVVPGADGPYFDRERWKEDARQDGAANALSSYDGMEHFVTYDGDDEADAGSFYVYRTN